MPLRSQPNRDRGALKPRDVEVLVVLLNGELHGYGIAKAMEERATGPSRVEPANLYRRIRRLMKAGLVSESEERPDPAVDDERRRYYALTSEGREALAAEAERMRSVVAEVEAKGLIPGGSTSA